MSILLAHIPFWFIRSVAILFGFVFGSFLNVVIARLPKDESVVFPGSHCVCGCPIKPYDNIPVVSWILLRGRARCCKSKISIRYPLIETIGAVVAWAIVEVYILTAPSYSPFFPLVARACAEIVIALALIAAAFIDLDHMYLPDSITIGGTLFAVLTSLLRTEIGIFNSLTGLIFGIASTYIPFILLYRWIRGRPGMGLGDVKLQALVGAWFGWQGVLFTLFLGSIQGTIATLIVLARNGTIREPDSVIAEREQALADGTPLDPQQDPLALPPSSNVLGARIPFGPFLILAALEYLLFGQHFISHYFRIITE